MTDAGTAPALLGGSDPSESARIGGLEVPEGYVPFSSRYGYRTHLDSWGRDAFSSRHTHGADEDRYQWSHCERDQRFRCACPGSPGHPRCCHRATQEDRLCDACRDWCVAVDSLRQYHRFLDLYAEVAS